MKIHVYFMSLILVVGLISGPTTAQDYISKANKYFLTKDYKNAITEYKQALKSSPKNHQIHYNLGVCYEKLNNIEEALKAYKRALNIRPTFIEARNAFNRLGGEKKIKNMEASLNAFTKANSSFFQQDYNTAIIEYNRAIKNDSSNFQAHHNLAFCYEKNKNYDQALTIYQKALALNPQSGNTQTAIERIKRLFNARSYSDIKKQAQGYFDEKNYQNASKSVERLLKLNSRDSWALNMRRVIQDKIAETIATELRSKKKSEALKAEKIDSVKLTKADTKSVEVPKSEVDSTQSTHEASKSDVEMSEFKLEKIPFHYILIAVLIVVAMGIGVLFVKKGKKEAPQEDSKSVKNPISMDTKKPESKESPVEELSQKGVYELLRQFFNEKRSGILYLQAVDKHGGEMQAEIRMLKGNIIDAFTNNKQAIPALYQMMEITEPTKVQFQEMQVSSSGNIKQSTLPLLMQWTLGMKNNAENKT